MSELMIRSINISHGIVLANFIFYLILGTVLCYLLYPPIPSIIELLKNFKKLIKTKNAFLLYSILVIFTILEYYCPC